LLQPGLQYAAHYAPVVLIGSVLGPTQLERDGRPVDLGGPLPRRLVTAPRTSSSMTLTGDAEVP